jgi:hypothetical protein
LQGQTVCRTFASVSTGEESFYVTANAADEKVSIRIIVKRSIRNFFMEEIECVAIIGPH